MTGSKPPFPLTTQRRRELIEQLIVAFEQMEAFIETEGRIVKIRTYDQAMTTYDEVWWQLHRAGLSPAQLQQILIFAMSEKGQKNDRNRFFKP